MINRLQKQPNLLQKRFQVLKHLNTSKHNTNNKLVDKSKQTFNKNTFENKNKQPSFVLNLCQAMIKSDIHLSKLNHLSFKFFRKIN